MEITVGQSDMFDSYEEAILWLTELEESNPEYDFDESLILPDNENGSYYVLVHARKVETK